MNNVRLGCWSVAIAIALSGSAHRAAAETRRAVLVGIDKYIPPAATRARTPVPVADASTPSPPRGRARGVWTDLEGAVNDADAIREVLIARFGFRRDDVHVLRNGEATRDRIVSEIRRHLIDAAAPGDVSLFFYAGHGSQVRNSKSDEPDKMDETIVPADANAGQPDLRDKELARVFNEALDKKVWLTLVFDSCHSGSISRGLVPIRFRRVAPDDRDVADPVNPPALESRGALVLSAAQSHQLAGETEDEDRTPHGLFTWALVKTLRSMPIDESADRMFLSLRGLMQSAQGGQEPDFSTTPERRRASLFGVRNGALSGATIVAVESIEKDGTVTLQGGLAAGIRKDAELRATGDRAESAPALRVIDAQGMARSRAAVTHGSAQSIRPGMLFEVVRWAAPGGPALRVWLGAAATAVTPALRARLGAGTRNDAIDVLSSPATADYVLVARQRESIAEYAWERPLFGALPSASALPARTDWVAVDSERSAAAQTLADQAVRLGVIRSWLQLESPADAEPFPYHLALRNTATGEVKTTGTARDGESYELVLLHDDAMEGSALRSRYVYVVAFDSSGKSVLLFPSANGGAGENYLPPRDETGRPPAGAIRVGRDRYTIGAPFGVDTYVMLATASALADPTVLEGEAVRTRGMGTDDALTRLLSQTGSATRGLHPATPTDWTIERLTIESVPATAK